MEPKSLETVVLLLIFEPSTFELTVQRANHQLTWGPAMNMLTSFPLNMSYSDILLVDERKNLRVTICILRKPTNEKLHTTETDLHIRTIQ